MAIFVAEMTAQAGDLLNVPAPTTFNDQSALNVKSNLQSKQYQDFIRTLYHHDAGNLARVDDLFAHPEKVDEPRRSIQTGNEAQQPSYSDYIKTQPYFGITLDSTKRFIRSPQAIRPLFVYRIFQERTIAREEERARRRLIAQRRRISHQPSSYQYH